MSATSSLFMQIDGIEGTATDATYAKWIAINHVSNGVFQSAHIDNTNNNLVKDGAHFDNISFSKEFDSTSTQLFMAVVQGTIIKKIVIAVGVDADDGKKEIARWVYEDCVLTMNNTSIQGLGGGISENLSFVYSTVTYQTNFLGSDNTVSKQGPVFWNLKKNGKAE